MLIRQSTDSMTLLVNYVTILERHPVPMYIGMFQGLKTKSVISNVVRNSFTRERFLLLVEMTDNTLCFIWQTVPRLLSNPEFSKNLRYILDVHFAYRYNKRVPKHRRLKPVLPRRASGCRRC